MDILFRDMKIHYVTSNMGKFEEAAKALNFQDIAAKGYSLVHTPLELDEIQGNALDIARHKINQGFALLNAPCVVDDVSLYCPALKGLPGPYIRSFLEALGDSGFANLLSHYQDHSCKVVCHIAFQSTQDDPLIFEGVVAGIIVQPRGARLLNKHSWNAIFQPEGSEKTFAEMTLEEASHFSARFKALTNFRKYLLS